MEANQQRRKVSIIGGGSWGTTIASKIAPNVKRTDDYDDEVVMWVFEETIDGRKLTDIINEERSNCKYLPGIPLDGNIRASSDLLSCASDADVLLFAVPGKFLPRILLQLEGKVKPNSIAISLIKGVDFEDGNPILISEMIRTHLGLNNVGVLMGANVASDVIKNEFVEATLACTNRADSEDMKNLFNSPTFEIQVSDDVGGTELCGAFKNIVAMGAGFCDALGFGESTKAAIIRKGICEMISLCKLFVPSFQLETIFNSCGVADVIASCYGGRNRRCAKEFAERCIRGDLEANWSVIEDQLLGGQRLQGLDTCDAVYEYLGRKELRHEFPLFCRIFQIAHKEASPDMLFS
eukprot:gene4718-9362_t